MTSAADVASFNAMVAVSMQKPGAYETLQKQFRNSATQGLPTVLAAALLKKNFLTVRSFSIAQAMYYRPTLYRDAETQPIPYCLTSP